MYKNIKKSNFDSVSVYISVVMCEGQVQQGFCAEKNFTAICYKVYSNTLTSGPFLSSVLSGNIVPFLSTSRLCSG